MSPAYEGINSQFRECRCGCRAAFLLKINITVKDERICVK